MARDENIVAPSLEAVDTAASEKDAVSSSTENNVESAIAQDAPVVQEQAKDVKKSANNKNSKEKENSGYPKEVTITNGATRSVTIPFLGLTITPTESEKAIILNDKQMQRAISLCAQLGHLAGGKISIA